METQTIETMAKEAPAAVKEIDEWGANLAKLDNGKFDQRFFGAHTYRRTCYSETYRPFYTKCFTKKVKEIKIEIFDSEYVTDLLVEEQTCFGAVSFNIKSGERTVIYQMQLSYVLVVILKYGKGVHLEEKKITGMVCI